MESLFEKYEDLIRNLPLEEHSFTTKKKNWKNINPEIIEYHEDIFGQDTEITISRKDLFRSFNNDPIETFILKVIYWGYPAGMRGDNFKKITSPESLFFLKKFLNDIKQNDVIDEKRIGYALKTINGLGLSTLSKYLYFTKSTFMGKRCLILDRELIKIFNNMYFVEFNGLRKVLYPCTVKNYFDYIDISHHIAEYHKFEADRLEMFLFIFGNHLNLEPTGDDGFWDESWDCEPATYEFKKLEGSGRIRVLEISPDDIKKFIDQKISYPLPYSNFNELYSIIINCWDKYADISSHLLKKEVADGLKSKKIQFAAKKLDEFIHLFMEALSVLYGLHEVDDN